MSQAKQLRHDLVSTLAGVPATQRLAARDTLADVGTNVTTASEACRDDLTDVVAAGFKRVEQSLRSLEEFGKLIDPGLAAVFELLRYRAYTLERAVTITADSIQRLAAARLYVLVDGRESLAAFSCLVESLVAAGADVIQLRDKRLSDRELLERARLLRKMTTGTATLFIMNDRADLAALAAADGVHVGQDELSVKDARAIVGPRALVGVSTHSLAQARHAVLEGANYIGVGPTFRTGTKSFERLAGVELLRQVAAEIRLPAFAIGGISAENVRDVLAAGIDRVAVSGAVLAATDPTRAVCELRRLLSDQA
jgi:thiamine-phosphate pyrophosphorylase